MSTDKNAEPMTLVTLKEVVDRYLQTKREGHSITVCIPNNEGGMGGTPVTYVTGASGGIDWDAGKFFIYPEVKMIKRPPDFTETEFQEALQRISSLETQLDILIRAVDGGDPRHIPHRIKHAKQVLEIYKKKTIKRTKE
jgi:hypothetical protein